MKKILGISLGVIAMIIFGFIVATQFISSPSQITSFWWRTIHASKTQRDIQRVYGLRETVKSVVAFYHEKNALPENINVLANESLGNFHLMIDPASRTPYQYRTGSEREIKRLTNPQPIFEVCANFEAPSLLIRKDITPRCPPGGICTASLHIQTTNPIVPEDKDETFWEHAKGYNCWTFGADGQWISSTMLKL